MKYQWVKIHFVSDTIQLPCGRHYVPRVVVRPVYTFVRDTAQALNLEE